MKRFFFCSCMLGCSWAMAEDSPAEEVKRESLKEVSELRVSLHDMLAEMDKEEQLAQREETQ